MKNWDKCLPGQFPECGCHYTTDDDGVHFCPLHAAASELLAACKVAVERHKQALGIRIKLTGLTGGKLSEEVAQIEAAIAKAEGRPA